MKSNNKGANDEGEVESGAAMVRGHGWGFWMLLTGWREWRAEERQIEMECEEERMKAIWQAQRMKERERALEAAGRTA